MNGRRCAGRRDIRHYVHSSCIRNHCESVSRWTGLSNTVLYKEGRISISNTFRSDDLRSCETQTNCKIMQNIYSLLFKTSASLSAVITALLLKMPSMGHEWKCFKLCRSFPYFITWIHAFIRLTDRCSLDLGRIESVPWMQSICYRGVAHLYTITHSVRPSLTSSLGTQGPN